MHTQRDPDAPSRVHMCMRTCEHVLTSQRMQLHKPMGFHAQTCVEGMGSQMHYKIVQKLRCRHEHYDSSKMCE
eukprot:11471578-Alexandrium_andersonii.AAC.1